MSNKLIVRFDLEFNYVSDNIDRASFSADYFSLCEIWKLILSFCSGLLLQATDV